MSKYPNFQGDQPCAQVGSEFYYLEQGGEAVHIAEHLRPLCHSCPYFRQCRLWAIKHEEYGFWGGMTASERKRYRILHKVKLESPHVPYMPKEEVA